MGQIIETDARTEGQPCRNCGLPMWRECVTLNGDHGGRGHNHHFCVSCGLLLGHVSRAQVTAWYADGHAAVNLPMLDGYFERLGVAWG